MIKNINIFKQFWISGSNHNWKTISDCCDKSDHLSHDYLRAVSSAQIADLTQNIIKEITEVEKKEEDQDIIIMYSRQLQITCILLDNS